VCDWLHDFQEESGQVLGDVVYVRRQKNDQHAKGMLKRFAYSDNHCTSIPHRVCLWKQQAGLQVHPRCTKWANESERAKPCGLCGKLFPSFRGPRLGSALAANGNKMSKDAVGDALAFLLTTINVPVAGFSSKSMRRGGLSQAKRAGIPAEVRRLQSGHKSNANKVYESDEDTDEERCDPALRVRPRNGWQPEHIYHVSRAFGL